jgi:uncharacterized membrane protein
MADPPAPDFIAARKVVMAEDAENAQAPRSALHRQMTRARAPSARDRVPALLVWFAARNFLPVTRFLLAWNAGVWLFLALVLHLMANATVTDLRKRATLAEEGRVATLIVVTLATVVAFIALGLELADVLQDKAPDRPLRVAIALAAIFGSWLFVNFAFALHYAHEVYRTKRNINALALSCRR